MLKKRYLGYKILVYYQEYILVVAPANHFIGLILFSFHLGSLVYWLVMVHGSISWFIGILGTHFITWFDFFWPTSIVNLEWWRKCVVWWNLRVWYSCWFIGKLIHLGYVIVWWAVTYVVQCNAHTWYTSDFWRAKM